MKKVRVPSAWTWIDDVLAASFPASDPPSWTPGVARLNPAVRPHASTPPPRNQTLQRHDLVPHFEVTDLSGRRVAYSSIWQRKNLVLVILPDAGPRSRRYVDRLSTSIRTMNAGDTSWIVTRDPVDGLPRPGVVVADQWGEIAHVAGAAVVEELPAPDELIDWLRYVQSRCPECEGEAR